MHSILVALLLCATDPAAADPQARYDAAVQLLLDGRLADGARALEALAQDPAAAGPVADRAAAVARVARQMATRGRFVLRAPALAEGAPTAGRPARLDRSGRGELAIYSTLYGTWAGAGTAVLLGVDDGKAVFGLVLAGSATGLAWSVLGTRDTAMPSGRAQAIESAANWGTFNGGMIAALTDVGSDEGAVAATLGTGLLALGTTALATSSHAPSSGDVAIANSGGIWGLVGSGFLLLTLGEPSENVAESVLLLGADGGLLTMALLSRHLEISRSRSLLIDAGGVIGTLAGVAVPVFAGSDNARAYGVSGLLGMAGGLALATKLTEDWDRDERTADAGSPRAAPFLTRGADGALSAGIAGRF